MRIQRGAIVATSLLQCFRSASYASPFALLPLASEFALLMAEQIKADFRANSFNSFHRLRNEIPHANGKRALKRLTNGY
ncbi:hypothetical protein GQ56_0107050 [Burkholderia paludis]|uniref:hypothetical protein n=1 Tax=Burkholderia paludis TaxID=1506587 RepID=UPI0004DB5752|nr:hypothetical protein [Burkholderia paludis]KFG98027.1 hypothetical protein GQ56_0107050 [Burkholderia paludis]